MTPLAVALLVCVPFTALRLIRLLTTDKIAEQLVIRHIRIRAAVRPGTRGDLVPSNLAGYLVEMLDCPFCIGFWVCLLTVTVALPVALFAPAVTVLVCLIVYASLGLSYVVGHISHRIDE